MFNLKNLELKPEISSNCIETIQISEVNIAQFSKIFKDISNLIDPKLNMNDYTASQIIKSEFSVHSKEISLLKTIQYIKVKFHIKLQIIKFQVNNLTPYQKEMTPKIYEIYQKLRDILSLPCEKEENLKFGNICQQPTDLYYRIIDKLTNLNAPPIILKALSNILCIDVRDLCLSESNPQLLNAFKEIITMNSLFTNIIINQYDFTRDMYEGHTKTLKEDVQIEIFKKIANQEGFTKFFFGIFN